MTIEMPHRKVIQNCINTAYTGRRRRTIGERMEEEEEDEEAAALSVQMMSVLQCLFLDQS